MPTDQLAALAITTVLATVVDGLGRGKWGVEIFEQVFPYRLDHCTMDS